MSIHYDMIKRSGNMGKRIQINLRISAEDKKQLERDAKKEQRTVSNLLLWCWKTWKNIKKE